MNLAKEWVVSGHKKLNNISITLLGEWNGSAYTPCKMVSWVEIDIFSIIRVVDQLVASKWESWSDWETFQVNESTIQAENCLWVFTNIFIKMKVLGDVAPW